MLLIILVKRWKRNQYYWNNKLTANAVLLTRLLYFRDVGFPFEDALHLSSNATRLLISSYLSQETFKKTPGGLILLNPDGDSGPLLFAATASFLTKLYSDYNKLVPTSGLSCSAGDLSSQQWMKQRLKKAEDHL
ncbi:endoglucanase 9-like isoform X1 [Euphorbia lathyris]|uniref:endoglucanase 9-like isoform X1 n=1 Tax=Euphorbia lathyris TaxID=212925 RepID=UPI003313DC92